MLFIPLTMSTGVVGMVEYLGFFLPHLSWTAKHLIDLVITGLVVILLYRRMESIRWISTGLWVVMVSALLLVIAACFSDFNLDYAFTYPKGAWSGVQFITGLCRIINC
jgi:amino acid transporter